MSLKMQEGQPADKGWGILRNKWNAMRTTCVKNAGSWSMNGLDWRKRSSCLAYRLGLFVALTSTILFSAHIFYVCAEKSSTRAAELLCVSTFTLRSLNIVVMDFVYFSFKSFKRSCWSAGACVMLSYILHRATSFFAAPMSLKNFAHPPSDLIFPWWIHSCVRSFICTLICKER